MNIVAIIPARAGSKAVIGKNIKRLGNYPLIAYSIAAAKLSRHIEQIIVTTDSKEIAEISRYYGAEVPFLRPPEISEDNSLDIDFFKHYLTYLKDNDKELPEYMVHLRPTTPLREVGILDKGLDYILSQSDATGMRSVHPSSISPYKIFKMEGPYLVGFYPDDPRIEYYNLPRQTFPQSYIPNGYVDVVRTSTIETGLLHGKKMLGFVTDKIPDIDVYEDYKNAEEYLDDRRFIHLLDYLETKYGSLS